MKLKPITSLVAGALLVASTAAIAQSAPAPAPQPAVETVDEGSALMGDEVATTLGVLFGIFVLVLFIWGQEDEGPLSP